MASACSRVAYGPSTTRYPSSGCCGGRTRAANPARVRSSARCPDHSGFWDVETCTYNGPSAPVPELSEAVELPVIAGTPRGRHVVSHDLSAEPVGALSARV